ncbi:MAG: hypothetical protein M3139_01225 [Bacteroidota bacterium]|nr:hypothetical protein [Bacteroidota bacterium]
MKKVTFLFGFSFLFLHAFSQQQIEKPASDSFKFKIEKQPRFYVNIHGGFTIGLGSTFKFYPDDVTSIVVQQKSSGEQTSNVIHKEQKKGLGDGFRVGAGFSYIINDFINVGLDVDYFKSTISKTRDSSYKQIDNNNIIANGYDEEYKISYKAILWTFTPNITFKAISRPKFFIYNKIGAVLVIRPNSLQYETQNMNYTLNSQGTTRDSSGLNTKRYEWGLRNPAFGFMGGVGGQFKLSEKVRLFFEAQFTHVVFMVKNRILTNYQVDGKEIATTLPLSSREIIFKDSYASNNSSVNPNQPTVAVYERFPITYVGFQTGIAYRF